MTDYPAGYINVTGTKCNVYVTENGEWRTTFEGEWYQAESKEALRGKISTALKKRKVKVEVPFTALAAGRLGRTVQTGIATGIHAATRNILVRWDDGKAEQLSPYDNNVLGVLNQQEREEWLRLADAKQQAVAALDKFTYSHKINLATAVRDAIEEAAK